MCTGRTMESAWQMLLAIISLLMLQSVCGKKNVLFLVSDDMRPQITAYEGDDFPSTVHPQMHTPNLDALAAKSLLLKRAYVSQAICSPSRTALLTGRRPDTTHVYDLQHYFRNVGGNFTTLPEYFKLNGYTSVGMGKIFHPGTASGHDDPISWSEPYYHAPNLEYWQIKESWRAVPEKETKQRPLPDVQIAEHAIETMKKLKESDNPFFLAVGFHKPHLPFVFPEEFLDFYPEDQIQCPDNQYAPVGMPDIAFNVCGGIFGRPDIKTTHVSGKINTTLPAETVKTLRRAYYSALSYTDTLIGYVIKALDELGLQDNTIISFWGDHGWQLGEHGEWCKMTNFELATHAPMMIHIPGLTDHGIVTEQLTEFVDLYPTLVEAAELPPLPLCPEDSTKTKLCREGMSLMPLINDPLHAKWKDRAFSQYPRAEGKYMGYTMRTDRYRYTEWVKFSGPPEYKPSWDDNEGIELYDHQDDPEENHNLAHHPDLHQIKDELSKMLHDGWRAALPSEELDGDESSEVKLGEMEEKDMVIMEEVKIEDEGVEIKEFVQEKKLIFKGSVNPKFDIL